MICNLTVRARTIQMCIFKWVGTFWNRRLNIFHLTQSQNQTCFQSNDTEQKPSACHDKCAASGTEMKCAPASQGGFLFSPFFNKKQEKRIFTLEQLWSLLKLNLLNLFTAVTVTWNGAGRSNSDFVAYATSFFSLKEAELYQSVQHKD